MSTIANGYGIRSVQRFQDARVAGEPVGPGYDRPYENPFLAQISTITLSATADVSDEIVADQEWSIVLTDPDGVAYETLYTVTAADNTAGTDGAGLAYMAGRLAAALEANSELINLVSATASGAVITITWLHPNAGAWTVVATCTPAAAEAVLTDVVATSQTAGGAVIPMARFVAEIAPTHGQGVRRARLPTGATDRIAGVALRDITQVRLYDTSPTAVDSYPIGSMLGVREVGDVHMTNTGDVAAAIGDPVYAVISTTGGDALGEARPTPDGTADVWTLTPTAANTTAFSVQVYFPEWNGEGPQTFIFGNFTSDGSGDATEISTGITDQMDANAAFTALVVATGTDTIILTGQDLGRPFVVTDSGEAGDFTSITHTTTAAAYTVLVPRARWVRAAAPAAVGTINLSR